MKRVLMLALAIQASILAQKPAERPASEGSVDKRIEELERQVRDLKKSNDDLEGLIEDVLKFADKSWGSLRNQIDRIEERHFPPNAALDPAKPGGYALIHLDSGLPLAISLKKLEPYLDGYKVTIQIGNPNTATFRGYSVNAVWADAGGAKKARTVSTSFPSTLEAGAWIDAEMILPNSAPADVKEIRVSVETNTIELRSGR
jgi:hypothetical protein